MNKAVISIMAAVMAVACALVGCHAALWPICKK